MPLLVIHFMGSFPSRLQHASRVKGIVNNITNVGLWRFNKSATCSHTPLFVHMLGIYYSTC